ncbi:TonB C-terminal domain-containing protein [Marinobacter daepoensis]|uniref:TonB C-terminal domain-containing protein n=2 Tax=Marinobacter daepoensis TaxID=262077 RepID=A0ABS3BI72_9GAMM|nr:TonB C-terminal domain-containing protein [Marinobacter daepoensis]MBY6080053.1 TonB C-terminal domain-containing protein [Marinobacter daepoensis]
MTGTGTQAPAMPATYRLALAVSIAVLAHTLILAGLPSPTREEALPLPHRLVFTLSSPATEPSPESSEASHHPRSGLPEHTAPAAEPVVTTRPPLHRAPPKQDTPSPTPRQQASDRPQTPKVTSPAAQASQSSSLATSTPGNAPNPIQRISNSPTEQDPYLIKLATHLAEKLEHRRVPAISKLKNTVTMEIELRLMPNGALTRARITESTGIHVIDEAAYRMALAASPYPSPEGEDSDRFGVKLVFTPKQP